MVARIAARFEPSYSSIQASVVRHEMPSVIPVPADEVLLDTTRVQALRAAGYEPDCYLLTGQPIVYPRDTVHLTRYCLMRHGGVSDTADTLRPPPPEEEEKP